MFDGISIYLICAIVLLLLFLIIVFLLYKVEKVKNTSLTNEYDSLSDFNDQLKKAVRLKQKIDKEVNADVEKLKSDDVSVSFNTASDILQDKQSN